MSEMIAFQEKLTGALAVNGAESQRAHSELDHLAGKFTNLERAQSRSEDVDIAEVMTQFSAIQVKAQLQSQLIKNAEDTYIHLADLL
jgi:flagellin-like hook-associated protein FlgL